MTFDEAVAAVELRVAAVEAQCKRVIDQEVAAGVPAEALAALDRAFATILINSVTAPYAS